MAQEHWTAHRPPPRCPCESLDLAVLVGTKVHEKSKHLGKEKNCRGSAFLEHVQHKSFFLISLNPSLAGQAEYPLLKSASVCTEQKVDELAKSPSLPHPEEQIRGALQKKPQEPELTGPPPQDHGPSAAPAPPASSAPGIPGASPGCTGSRRVHGSGVMA